MGTGKHTPGPWEAEPDLLPRSGKRWKVTAATPKPPRRYTVTVVVNYDKTDETTAEADARLIAAAPELLAACEAMLKRFGMHSDGCVKLAADAVAKAKGGA